MVRVAVMSLLLCAGCGSVARNAPDAPIADASAEAASDGPSFPAGLVAWYPMDGFVQQSVPDVVAHADGTCSGTSCPTLTTNGRIGGALVFDGASQLVHVGSTDDLKTMTAFTVTVWVRRVAGAASACIVNKGFGAGDNNSWQACVTAAGQLTFYSTAPDGTTDAQASAPTIETERWYHVALWWNGSIKATYIAGSATASGPADIAFDDSAITIGADVDPGMPVVLPLKGELDDLRIYNRALSGEEIFALATP